MSTLLSTISRQCDPSMRIEFHDHGDHCPSAYPSIVVGKISAGGVDPSGSCQTSSWPLTSPVGQRLVRANRGVRLAYGTSEQRPVEPCQRQSWNGHANESPLTVPWDRSPPMWRQYASSTCSSPCESANTTRREPNALIAWGCPSRKFSA